jgi:hypothetical protein
VLFDAALQDRPGRDPFDSKARPEKSLQHLWGEEAFQVTFRLAEDVRFDLFALTIAEVRVASGVDPAEETASTLENPGYVGKRRTRGMPLKVVHRETGRHQIEYLRLKRQPTSEVTSDPQFDSGMLWHLSKSRWLQIEGNDTAAQVSQLHRIVAGSTSEIQHQHPRLNVPSVRTKPGSILTTVSRIWVRCPAHAFAAVLVNLYRHSKIIDRFASTA